MLLCVLHTQEKQEKKRGTCIYFFILENNKGILEQQFRRVLIGEFTLLVLSQLAFTYSKSTKKTPDINV